MVDNVYHFYLCAVKKLIEELAPSGTPTPTFDDMRDEVSNDYFDFYYNHGVPRSFSREDISKKLTTLDWAVKDRPKLFPETIIFLSELNRAGVRVALVSSRPHEDLLRDVEIYGVGEYFEFMVGGARPKSEIFEALVAEMGGAIELAAGGGDVAGDVIAAQDSGVIPFICPRGFQTPKRAKDLLADRPRPYYFVKNLEDILRFLL